MAWSRWSCVSSAVGNMRCAASRVSGCAWRRMASMLSMIFGMNLVVRRRADVAAASSISRGCFICSLRSACCIAATMHSRCLLHERLFFDRPLNSSGSCVLSRNTFTSKVNRWNRSPPATAPLAFASEATMAGTAPSYVADAKSVSSCRCKMLQV